MAFSSRLKRQKSAISAAHTTAITPKMVAIVELASTLGDLADRLQDAPESERAAIEREGDAILALINELRNG
jgi:hypothetical protein